MTTDRLWRALAVLLPTLAAILAPMSTVDLTYHLRAGAEMLTTGAIPTTDTWTFTAAGAAWFDQQWGAQVVLHVVQEVGGWTGLVVLRAVLTGLVFGCLLAIAVRRGLGSRTAALLVLLAFAVAAPAMALRPQLLGMACLAVVLVLVDRRHEHPRGLWLVPVIVAIWANLHGSFFLGPLVLGLAWLADLHDRVPKARATGLVALAAAGAACLTPFGPAVWLYAVGLSVDPSVTDRISEWRPTSLRTPAGIVFFGSIAAVAVVVARRAVALPWPTIVWLATFAAIGLYAERGIAWWALAAVAPVAGLLPVAGPARARADLPAIRGANAVLVGLLAAAGVALLPAWRPLDPGTGTPAGLLTDAPSGITGYLRSTLEPGDKILNEQRWGSWFEYALPDVAVAVDSRIETIPADVWSAYEAVLAGVDGWQAHVADWEVTHIVTGPPTADLEERLASDAWRPVHRDDDGIVWTR